MFVSLLIGFDGRLALIGGEMIRYFIMVLRHLAEASRVEL